MYYAYSLSVRGKLCLLHSCKILLVPSRCNNPPSPMAFHTFMPTNGKANKILEVTQDNSSNTILIITILHLDSKRSFLFFSRRTRRLGCLST